MLSSFIQLSEKACPRDVVFLCVDHWLS
jgi:hypothetical protein